MKKILISAFAFSPKRGSEAAVGWNIATGLAREFKVTVLTGDISSIMKGKQELKEYFLNNNNPQIENLKIYYISPSILMMMLEKAHRIPGFWMLYYLSYNLWQRKAFKFAKGLHAEDQFDLCHQLTYIGYREPGYLYKLKIPFMWGPVSGSETIPMSYYSIMGVREMLRPLSRDIGNYIQKLFPGRVKEAAEKAFKILSVSTSEIKLFRDWGIQSELMLETGTSYQTLNRNKNKIPGKPIRFVWSGIFSPRKALPIALAAFSRIQKLNLGDDSDWEFVVIGDGVMRKKWISMASALGCSSKISWAGFLERGEAIKLMSQCDVLIHTGLREGTPHVILEALSLGLPVICHDCGGMGTVITGECGIKIPLKCPEKSTEGFTGAIKSFIQEKQLLAKYSAAAISRSDELSWKRIVERIGNSYHNEKKLN